jgi:hypothetical protein
MDTNYIPEVRPLDASDLTILGSYYSRLVNPPADLNAAMMIAWRDALNLQLIIRRGILYVIAFWNGAPTLWGPPIGDKLSRGDFRYGLELIRTIGGSGVQPSVLYLWKEYDLWPWLLEERGYRLSFQRSEYVYSTQVLSSLDTPQLRKKRQERNRFERRFAPILLPYDSRSAGECIDLLERWIRYRRGVIPSEFLPKFDIEARVCRDALAGTLKMHGVVAKVAGRVEAFSLGVRHTSRCSQLSSPRRVSVYFLCVGPRT